MALFKKGIPAIVWPILVAGTLLLLWFGYKTKQKAEYQHDVTYAYSIAEKLGYTNERFLTLDHRYSFGDGYYDTINISFSTNKSAEQLAQMIHSLGFIIQDVYGPFGDDSFTSSFNANKTEKLILSSRNANDVNVLTPIPILTTWVLVDEGRFIDIQFAEKAQRSAYWSYNNHMLEGNIVIVTLNRHLKK